METRDITARRYHLRHSLQLPAGKAKEISSNVIQAREYFRNAATADFAVAPLLQYYGVSALSRALVLFLMPRAREATLKPGHGLRIYNWRQVLSDGPARIGALTVGLTKGVLNDLLVATVNRFYFRANSSVVNWYVGGDHPGVDARFAFQDMVARVPDISPQYAAWTGQESHFLLQRQLKVDRENDQYEFVIHDPQGIGVDGAFPRAHCPNRHVFKTGKDLTVRYDKPFIPFFSQKAGFFGIGDVVLYPPLASQVYVTPLAVCVILSYTLGMLCRYFPATWIMTAQSQKGDGVYPLLVRLFDWIQSAFPPMVVDLIHSPYDFEEDTRASARGDGDGDRQDAR